MYIIKIRVFDRFIVINYVNKLKRLRCEGFIFDVIYLKIDLIDFCILFC